MQTTLKLKYECSDEGFKEFFDNHSCHYTSCLHFLVNRILDSSEDLSEKALRKLSKSINNIDSLNSWDIQSCVRDAQSIVKSFKSRVKEHEDSREKNLKKLEEKHFYKKISDHQYKILKAKILKPLKLIFGGKELFYQRLNGLINSKEFKSQKLNPIYSIGEAPQHGNRQFTINNDLSITYKPNFKNHFVLNLCFGANQKKKLLKLYNNALNCILPISYKLDKSYIYISFDLDVIENTSMTNQISNRVLAIDMNPNYIGWSITDWKSSSEFKVVISGVYNFKMFLDEWKELNNFKDVNSKDTRRLKINNKRKFEVIHVAKNIIDKAVYYQCQIISIEDLNMKASDKDKGKNYNALCNNSWLRNTFVYQLEKRASLHNINLLKVKPEYSSFIGNFLFRNLEGNTPDMVLASIEIGRRGYEFYNQYIIKTKEKRKNIIQPDIQDFKSFWRMSLEELIPEDSRLENLNLINLYNFIKTRKDILNGNPNKVRVQDTTKNWFRFSSQQSKVFTC